MDGHRISSNALRKSGGSWDSPNTPCLVCSGVFKKQSRATAYVSSECVSWLRCVGWEFLTGSTRTWDSQFPSPVWSCLLPHWCLCPLHLTPAILAKNQRKSVSVRESFVGMRQGACTGRLLRGVWVMRWTRVPLLPLGAIHDISGLLNLCDQFLFTKKLLHLSLCWYKRAAGRLFERSEIVHVWLVAGLSTVMDCVSHCGQVNLVWVCSVHCVSGVITASEHSTGRSRILLQAICGHGCNQTDPQDGNSVRDAMVPVSSSVACCLGEYLEWLELLPSPLLPSVELSNCVC